MKLSTIKKNPNNPRVIKDYKFKQLVNSIQSFPQMMELRPIVVDENNVVLGGNMRLAALNELKMKEIPDEWVLKASDLTEEQKKEFIIKDNNSFGEWDMDLIANEWSDLPLNDWGIDLPYIDVPEEKEEPENIYTQKIETPIYEPKNEKPKIKDLVNNEKTELLINEIESSDIPKEEKQFLIKAAQRHLVFNYEKLADYYAHSNKEVQNLMENSALVIIDFNKAIELGYTRLHQEITDQYNEEYGE